MAITDRKEWNFEDEKVQWHWQDDGTNEPDVPPRRHRNQRLVLRQTAHTDMTSHRYTAASEASISLARLKNRSKNRDYWVLMSCHSLNKNNRAAAVSAAARSMFGHMCED